MILEIENFITPELCEKIIDISKQKWLKNMWVLWHDNSDKARVADGTWLYEADISEYHTIRQSIASLIHIPLENQENPNIVSYSVGWEYKYHHDFFLPDTNYYNESITRGGQRSHTCILYLNDDYGGGQTSFFHEKKTIQPKKWKLIAWRNINENGSLNFDSLHAGLPVTLWEKWILVVFVRENAFH